MVKKGAAIYWASKAVAYETIPPQRTTLSWLIRRKYNGASTYIFVLKLERGFVKLSKKAITDIIYLLIGVIALLVTPFPFKHKYWGILRISESIGGLSGLLGFQYHEYSKNR